jgi:hypothetical protein
MSAVCCAQSRIYIISHTHSTEEPVSNFETEKQKVVFSIDIFKKLKSQRAPANV